MATNTVAKTVQEYIDECPSWSDGTPVSSAPMTTMQWRIWWLASAGKFFEGMTVFMMGVALPLIALEFDLGATQKGMLGAAPLFGILIGATTLGGLADHFGRRLMFISEVALFIVFLALVAWSPNFPWLLTCLFGMGIALGGDYPTAHLVISESTPSSSRGRLVLGAFGFQAVGAIAGTGVGLLVLHSVESIADWRLMYTSAIIPAVLVLVGRFFIPQSGHWLVSKKRIAEAERATAVLLRRDPPYPQNIRLKAPHDDSPKHAKNRHPSYRTLFSKEHCSATLLASVPWFLQDLGTYGIGIFTPIILAATIGVKNEHARNLAELIHNDILATRGAALIDVLLMVGIASAIFLVDKVGRIQLQIFGFLGCAAGLFLASFSVYVAGPTKLVFIFSGFMLFNFMTNLGPNAMTYLLAGEVFPTPIRGIGAGFAASVGKLGAVMTSFLFPILLKDLGTATLLYMLVGASLLGAVVTWRLGIETKGINLETIGQEGLREETSRGVESLSMTRI
jgi:MFS family permease